MPRNLNRRVEVLFPVLRPRLVRMLRDEVLHAYLEDRTNARRMSKDGSYAPKPREAGGVDSQARFLTDRSGRQS